MKIYTKTGDQGETGLYRASRVAKDDPRIEAFGAVDELNAHLGVVRALNPSAALDELLDRVQNQLFDLGAELATPDATASIPRVGEANIQNLELAIDAFEAQLPPLTQFILPGGAPIAAQLHVARGVCRRAERRVVTLARIPEDRVSPLVVVYLNRLSDLLFVAARSANRDLGVAETTWRKAT